MGQKKEKMKTEKTPLLSVEDTWQLTDGVLPKRKQDGAWDLLASLPIRIPPGCDAILNLGVVCNYPSHVIQSRVMLAKGVTLPDGIWAASDSGTSIVLTLKNGSREDLYIERGDVVARCVVFGGQ